jgi:hypothetical protein
LENSEWKRCPFTSFLDLYLDSEKGTPNRELIWLTVKMTSPNNKLKAS